jgi:hypothetical protein
MMISNTGDQRCDKNRFRLLESRMMRKYQVRFGGGQTKKEQQCHLVGWLPSFSSHSHGFRPDRGCHTALSESYHQWVGTTYFVEGDIAACFDSLDHTVMMNILREKIHDGRFLRLIETHLAAGYLEDWRYHQTLSGCPQGSILSPVLANVYLNKLDTFVETTLMPQYNKGECRKLNTAYTRVKSEAQRAICEQGNGRRQKPYASVNSNFLVTTPQTPTTADSGIYVTPMMCCSDLRDHIARQWR